MNPTTLLSGLGAAIAADPALGGASSAGRDSTPASGDLFLALVTGLLQGNTQAAGGLGEPAAVPGAPADPTATTGPADADEAAPTSAPVAVATGVAPPLVPGALATDDADSDAADPATDTPEPTTDGTELSMLPLALAVTPLVVQAVTTTSLPAGTDAASSVDAPAAAGVTTTSVPAPTADQPGQADAGADRGADPGATKARDRDATATAAPAPAALSTADPTTPSSTTSTAPRADARVDAVPSQVTATPPTVGVAPTTAPAAVAAPAPTTTDLPRVADQVFPEVLRVSANADTGTSRVTVKLNPESLGEVRVVLTHRRGELEVSLAAGSDARRALTEGAPELRRLLEAVGRADSRIVIRDLSTGQALPASSASPSTPTGPSARTDISTDLAGGAWSGAGRPGGEPAPDRDQNPRNNPGSTTATDGIPGTTTPSLPITTASRGHAGLDLSM